MADPGFSRGGGCEPSRGGVNTPNFPENCMKSKEFGCPGGGVRPSRPPRSANDLYQSLSAMKVDKVSGPDRLDVEFYRVFWPVIGRIVHASLLYAQTHGALSDSQRRGILRLIPKRNKDLLLIHNWRPITLLNTDYKLLSKTLANRLASVLPDLIHQDQKGFIRQRYIGDNIMALYSILAQVEQDEEDAWIILLDIYKAFDSVSWFFFT